jgi:elongation factor Ts
MRRAVRAGAQAKARVEAERRAGRIAREGLVARYVSCIGKVGALVGITYGTDFVARTPELEELATRLAKRVAKRLEIRRFNRFNEAEAP